MSRATPDAAAVGRPWCYHDGDTACVGEIHPPARMPNGRAVLVLHEADGIGENVRRRCAMLAASGYIAAAADLHGDGRILADDEIPGAMARFRGNPLLMRRRVAAAFTALADVADMPPRRIAVIGYCFGGYAALEFARSGAAPGGVASFHGLLTTAAPARSGDIHTAILAATGARDPLVPAPDVAAFIGEMTAADADWHLLQHGRALHSFTNAGVADLGDPRMAYDPLADAISWAAVTAFLERMLA